ncbi:hypothetical protein [Pedobacter sp. SYSU D00535]|uniref:hypothetical protein n=1 Tax=Pedobacter sp. SYSU D00535 TaxID=2810308 RepID=UPI001A9796FE|nr:hypothetical protein [Pedobacter sp. SYSU D00535]
MKPLVTILALSFAALASYAQSSESDESSLKPFKKNLATELNINPFKGELSLNNSLNQIKLRIFSSPRFAWRIGFSARKLDSLVENSNPYGSNPSIYKNERNSTSLALNLGFEQHLKGTRRLSPYYGLDLTLANKSAKQEITSGQSVTTIKGAWQTSTPQVIWVPNYNGGGQYQTVYTVGSGERGYTRYGLNLVTGFDFYMAKNFFFGYEFNFGFYQTNYQAIEVTQTGSSSATTPADVKDSNFSFGPTLYNGIRLGYVL